MNRTRLVTAFSLGLALLVTFAARPASAGFVAVGASSECTVVNPNRFQCNFPTLSANQTTVVQYVSMQCGSTGTSAFSLQEFQFLPTPPDTSSEVAYQIPLTNQPSLGGVVTAGARVTLYVAAGTSPRALIDMTPAPSGSTQCTASISGLTGNGSSGTE
jgi:hypothetical protein